MNCHEAFLKTKEQLGEEKYMRVMSLAGSSSELLFREIKKYLNKDEELNRLEFENILFEHSLAQLTMGACISFNLFNDIDWKS